MKETPSQVQAMRMPGIQQSPCRLAGQWRQAHTIVG